MPGALPKCPECEIEGIEYITCEESIIKSGHEKPWFEVAFCDECGHVYGVFAKVIQQE